MLVCSFSWILIWGILVCIYLSILVKVRHSFLKEITQLQPITVLCFMLQKDLKCASWGSFSRLQSWRWTCSLYGQTRNVSETCVAYLADPQHHNSSCRTTVVLVPVRPDSPCVLCWDLHSWFLTFDLFWSFDEAHKYLNFKILLTHPAHNVLHLDYLISSITCFLESCSHVPFTWKVHATFYRSFWSQSW